MKVVRLISLLLFAIIAPVKLLAQNEAVMSFSLKEAQDYAIQNFYVSKNAKLDILAAKKKVWETTAIGLPHITTNADDQYIPGKIPEFTFGEGPDAPSFPLAQRNSITYSATLSQLIFSGEYIVGLQASKTYKLLSEQGYEKTRISLKENIASTYYAILILKENSAIILKTLDNIRIVLDQARKTNAVGLLEDVDVDQLDLTYKRTENTLKTIDNQVSYMERLLKYQLGLDLINEIVLTDKIDELVALNIINDSTYSFNLKQNIDYMLLETQEKLQKLSLKREQSTFLPTISGFYMYQDKTNKSTIDFTINNILGASVSFPIFESGARIAKVGQARIEYEKAQNAINQESVRLTLEAQQAKLDYQTALEKYYNELGNIKLSEKVLNNASIKFKEGMISSLDLTTVNNQYLQVQISYSTAIQELLNAKVKLDKAYNQL